MLTDKQVEDGFSYEPEYEYANPTDTGYVQRNRRAFREWKAKVEREAAARELAHIRREIRSIPHWWNSEEQRGGFDLQPLGPDASSEEGAFMEVMRVLDARTAEIREGSANERS